MEDKRLAASTGSLFRLRSSLNRLTPLRVKPHNLAGNDRALHGEFCQGFLQGLETKVALVSGDGLALAMRYVTAV